mmetsp:Transcript_18918/g.41221  ORF Transcript_18918/g.41221 Transcript_18918/m.41221 type:complete len:89 (+) Transcript_18918:267-533(+)
MPSGEPKISFISPIGSQIGPASAHVRLDFLPTASIVLTKTQSLLASRQKVTSSLQLPTTVQSSSYFERVRSYLLVSRKEARLDERKQR